MVGTVEKDQNWSNPAVSGNPNMTLKLWMA
jgi:hypothetical protein